MGGAEPSVTKEGSRSLTRLKAVPKGRRLILHCPDNPPSYPGDSEESERVNGRGAWCFAEELCEWERKEKSVEALGREQVELMEPAKTLSLIDTDCASAACAPVTCSPER